MPTRSSRLTLNTLARVIEAPRTKYIGTGHVPAWAGVHLLRAWLFFLQRVDHWNDGLTAGDEEWRAVLAALQVRGEKAPTRNDLTGTTRKR